MKFILASLVACAVAQNCEADPDALSALQQGSKLNKQVSSVDALQERAQSIADVIKDGALEAGTAGKRGKKDKDKDEEVDKSCRRKRGKKKCLATLTTTTVKTTTTKPTTTTPAAPVLVNGGEPADAIFSLSAVSSLNQAEWEVFTAELKTIDGLLTVDAPANIKDLTAAAWRKMATHSQEEVVSKFNALCEVALTLRNLRHLSKDEWEEVVKIAADLDTPATLPAKSSDLTFKVFPEAEAQHVVFEAALTLHALRKLSDDEWTKLRAKHDDLPTSAKIADFPLATLLTKLEAAEKADSEEFEIDSQAAISTNRILQLDKEGYDFLRSKLTALPESQAEFDIDALQKIGEQPIGDLIEGEFDFDVAATGIAGRGDQFNLRGIPFPLEVTEGDRVFAFTFAEDGGYGYAS